MAIANLVIRLDLFRMVFKQISQISGAKKSLLAAGIVSLSLLAALKENIVPFLPVAQATDESVSRSGKSYLNVVRQRGFLICGVNGELPGFSYVNSEGKYAGIDVDLCRAIAAAIFDDPTKVEFRDLNASERFDVLKSGEIDLLSRNTTQTLSRDTDANLEFTPTIFYDAQGIMVNQRSEIKEPKDLAGKTICVPEKTTSYDNLQDYLNETKINAKILASSDRRGLFRAYEQNQCQAITGDISQLVARRIILANPQNHQILSTTISQEPLAPVLLHQDSDWFDVVKWVTFALIQAEELNITSENLNIYKRTKESAIRRFLGAEGTLGSDMGLSNDFAKRIIEHVGNYGEIYERNLGQPFSLPRGRNALWQDGGLMYSPPFN
ncbi:MAG: amino acid ABC transporter substrate-binding protein [Cyanobacteria bacterium P01_C01_bin.72]